MSYIAYTSFGRATESTSPLAADHRFTEQLIEESGIAHTFLRNNWYLENEAAFLAAGAKGGKLSMRAATAKLAGHFVANTPKLRHERFPENLISLKS